MDIISIFSSVAGLEELIVFLCFPLLFYVQVVPPVALKKVHGKRSLRMMIRMNTQMMIKNSKLNISYFFQLLHDLTALIIRIPKPVSKNRRIIK